MPHTLATLSEIIDDVRVPLQNILGQKIKTRTWAKKSTLKGNGKRVLQPIIVADDAGHGWITDGGQLAAADGGDPEELDIPWRFYAGRFRITGPTMKAAGGDRSQLEDASKFAMMRLESGISSAINRFSWSGGQVIGFLNERVADGDGGDSWEFTGDTTKLAALITELGGPVTAQIIRMDTYATVGTVEISAAVVATGLITIDDALDTSGVADGYACAVRITEAAFATTVLTREMQGIMGNLGQPTHFGLDRTTATGTALAQSNILTVGTVDGHNTRAAVSLARIQALLDLINERTRGERRPDRALYHPSLNQSLQSIFTGTVATNIQVSPSDGGKTFDVGAAGFSYAGIPFEEDVDAPKGGLFFVNDETWNTYMLSEGDFDSAGPGGPLYQVQGSDAVEAVWKEYQNLGCFAPNASGAVVGLQFPGEGDGAAV